MIPKRGMNGEISDYENEGDERRQKRLEKVKQRKEKLAAMTPDERCDYEMKHFIKEWCVQLRKKHHGDIKYDEIIGRAWRRFSDVWLVDILDAYPASEKIKLDKMIEDSIRAGAESGEDCWTWENEYRCSFCNKRFEQYPEMAFCPHCGQRCGPDECTLDYGDYDKYEFTFEDGQAREQSQYEKDNPDWVEGKRKLEALLERYEPGTREHEELTERLVRHNQLPKLLKTLLVTWNYRNLPKKYTQKPTPIGK